MKKITLSLSALLWAGTAFCQLHNGGVLTVQTGAVLTVEGNLANTTGSVLENRGTVHVKGNLTNDAAQTAYTGSLLFLNGSGAQTVGGTAPFSVASLTVDNVAGINLQQAIRVQETLRFLAGSISAPGVSAGVIFDGASAAATGITNTSHINGWSSVINRASFEFPLGNGTRLKKVLLSNIANPSSAVSIVYNGTNNKAANGTTYPGNIVDVSNNWYSVSATASTFDIGLPVTETDDYSTAGNLGNLRAMRKDVAGWTLLPTTVSGTISNGTVTSSGVTNGGDFALGVHSFILPIKLLNFAAAKTAGGADIFWQVLNEADAACYVVQKSSDGQTWREAGRQRAGTGTGLADYRLNDPAPFIPVTFYRLQIQEKDGGISYTSVARIETGEGGVRLYPTVANGNSRPQLTNTTAGTLKIHVIGMDGKTVAGFLLPPNSKQGINIAGWASGRYQVVIEGKTGKTVLPFLVER
ncbi:MAG: hypothetical protein EOO14_01290 [Chitinophagaceae bacterium]|nr:MAG: hypothetical protein EOO14_01290 [Chitinophagaceae bacterium]